MKGLILLTTGHEAIEFYRSGGVFYNLERTFQETGEPLTLNFKELPKGKDKSTDARIFNREIIESDFVFMDRAHTAQQVDFLEFLKFGWNRKVWLDYDDNLLSLDRGNPAFEYYEDSRVKTHLTRALKVADLVTVSTRALQDIYSQHNSNVVVIPNAWNPDVLPVQPAQARKKDEPFLIAWRGSNAHLMDVLTVQDFFRRAIKSERFKVMFFGWCPPFLPGPFAFAKYKGMVTHFRQFRDVRPDALIVPLADTHFNQGKSNIAYIEAAAAGVPTFAPFGLSEFNRPGVILYKDQDDLWKLINYYRKNENKRLNKIREAQKYLIRDLDLNVINNLRIKQLSLLQTKSAEL